MVEMSQAGSIQFQVRVYIGTMMAEAHGDPYSFLTMIQRGAFLLVSGTIVMNIVNLPELIYFLMLKIQEFLLRELLKHIKKELMLIHR